MKAVEIVRYGLHVCVVRGAESIELLLPPAFLRALVTAVFVSLAPSMRRSFLGLKLFEGSGCGIAYGFASGSSETRAEGYA